MNKIILLICGVFCVVIGSVYKYKTDELRDKFNDERETLISDVVKRDSILFGFSEEANNLFYSIQNLCSINKENAFLVVIPEQFCWNCFEPKAERLLEIKQKYDVQIIFVVPSALVRTFKMSLFKKVDYDIFRYTQLSDEIVRKIPHKNIVWGLYNQRKDIFLTYLDSNIINSLSFFEKNYFNQLNP